MTPWQLGLIILFSHLATFGLGCWVGERSKRAYKRRLYARLYGAKAHESFFLNHRRVSHPDFSTYRGEK